LCTLAAEEFIRRFLQHVLPRGWVKVRYFGFFRPAATARATATTAGRLAGSRKPASRRVS
jgi:hypothetical protein